MTDFDFDLEWHAINDAREEQAYLDDKADFDAADNLWYFECLVNSADVLHRHDHHDGRCFVITRDDRVTDALIWPVLVYEFNRDRSSMTITRLSSVSTGIDWIDERVKEAQAA